MGLASLAYCLWQRFLSFDPEQPIWPNRDRFVLSVGHASMLLYALLHLTGVKAVNPQYETLGKSAVTLDAIKRCRQLDSPCPGYPEYRWTIGVETTTGPLGRGSGWTRYTGLRGHIIGMRTFGASAPLKALQRKYEVQARKYRGYRKGAGETDTDEMLGHKTHNPGSRIGEED